MYQLEAQVRLQRSYNMNTQFSVAIHILTLLATEQEPVSSQYIAASINSNATLVRKICRYLKEGNLISSNQGVSGYSLKQPETSILLGQVFQIIFNQETHFAKIHGNTNPDCYVGKNISSALDSIYSEVDQAILKQLNNYSIQDVINRFN